MKRKLLAALTLAALSATAVQAASYQYRVYVPGFINSPVIPAATPEPIAADCTLPWGGLLASGATYPGSAYSTPTVASPATCASAAITLSCLDGVLSNPSASNACSVTYANCTLPWGGTLNHGETYSGTAYSTSSVTEPATCTAAEVPLSCSDGNLSLPTATNSCTVTPAADTSVLLMHMEGTVGTHFPRDEYGHTLYIGADAQHWSQARVGSTGLSLDGTGDYVAAVPNGNEFVFSGDFTVELWARVASSLGEQPLWAIAQGSTADTNAPWFGVSWLNGNSYPWRVYLGTGASSTTMYCSAATSSPLSTWRHVALVRSSGAVKLYVDGTALGCGTTTNATLGASGSNFQLGYRHSQTPALNGNLDEVRVSSSARYTANFTPPTAPFANPTGTASYVPETLMPGYYRNNGTYTP